MLYKDCVSGEPAPFLGSPDVCVVSAFHHLHGLYFCFGLWFSLIPD